MLKSYLKTAWRFLFKNKTYSFINIIGLATGTLCCLYIVLYVTQQYNYDKHHKDVANIYRINSIFAISGEKHNQSRASPPIAPTVKTEFGEVEQFTRVVMFNETAQHLLQYQDKALYENQALYVDSTFFDVFTYHFAYGNAKKVLEEPYTVVLLKPTADKLFGKGEDPVGKMITIDNAYGKHDFKVTGVVDESLGSSHIKAGFFMTMNSGGDGEFTRQNHSWAAYNYAASYIKLRPDTDPAALESKFPALLNKYGAEQLKSLHMQKVLRLQPVSTIHTTSGYARELSKTASSSFLSILLLIAGLIQLIACINFMNLSTARASKRAKEVGVRKVVGADRYDLIRQFLGESLLLSIVGVMIALPLLALVLPYLNRITEANITLSFLSDLKVWGMLVALAIVTGLIAGSYPAFYLSAFKAIRVLKGNFSNHISAAGIRRSLVVFQFVLSIVLITGIIVIYSQLNYIRNKDLGFTTDQRLAFTFHTADTKNKIPALVEALRQLPEVSVASEADAYLSQQISRSWLYFLAGGNEATGKDVQFIFSDEYFVKATGLHLISGRDFRARDSGRVLINETFAKGLGIDVASAPGKKIYPRQDPGEAPAYLEIVGVVKDFNFNSLHTDVKPIMLRYSEDPALMSNIVIAANDKDHKALLGKLGAAWHKVFPSVPFEYKFLDDEVQKQYESEATLSRILNSFALIAILISCLGLFGLAAFSAEQRTKEIGIRKVLGATVFNISTLLSKEFIKLVAIALTLAIPIAWWAMSQWLDGFAYRINISWWMYAAAGLMAMVITLCTVSFQAIRAAIVNPVKSLKME